MRYKIVTDPSKLCKSTHTVAARSSKQAVVKAVLEGHDWLQAENITEVKPVSDRGKINYVATISRLEGDPAPWHPLAVVIDPVLFWVECVVEKAA